MPARRRFVALVSVAAVAAGLALQPAQAVSGRAEPAGVAADVAARAAPSTASTVGSPDDPGQPHSMADGLPVDAGALGPDAPDGTSSAAPEGVADEVYRALADRERVPVIIRLRDQADAAALADAADAAATRAVEGRRATASSSALAEAAKDARARAVVSRLREVAADSQGRVRDLLTDRGAGRVTPYWIFNGMAARVDAGTVDTLAEHPDVASVTLDETIRLPEPAAEPGDPKLPSWSLEKVAAPKTWGEYGDRGEGVVVGVMDGGVDGTHPALRDSWRGVTGDPNESWYVPTGEDYPEPGDGDGHGTHVTGSIVGGPPGEITGVAPEAEWIAAKIFRDGGTSSTSIIHAGFQWMLAPGGDPTAAPDVVNNSWGSSNGASTEFWDDVNAWVTAGIVPMFANGNDGPAPGTVGSPGSYPHTIGVGATDRDDFIADFSSRGPAVWDGEELVKPQISAPGHQIRSTWPRDLEPSGYHTISGTSMATPHATGVVALMLSAKPDLTIDDVRQTLTGTARVEPHMGSVPNNSFGAGVVDAYAAVTRVAHSGKLAGTVTADGNPIAATVAVAGHTVRSDPDTGTYQLDVPEGAQTATISGYGHRTVNRDVTITAGETTSLDVALDPAPTRTLRGTVSADGDAVVDARVTLTGTPLDPAFTDDAGAFAVDVPEGDYEVRVSAAGFGPYRTDVEVAGDTDLSVELVELGQPTEDGWRQFQNNPARHGLASDALAADTLVDDWSADVGSDVVFSSPVIDGDHVYVGAESGQLVALNTVTGKRAWAFDTGDNLRGTPAVSGDLVISGGGVDGGIYAVEAATGQQRWKVDTPDRLTVYAAPVVRDGVVYVATGPSQNRSDTVFAIDAATGEQLWATDVGTSVFGNVAVAGDLLVVGNADDAQLIGLDAATGERRWTLRRDADYFIGGPSIADGTVYAATTDGDGGGSLLAVDAATGQLQWENATHGDGQGTTPAVYGDLVIAGSHGRGFVAAYDRSTGKPAWHYGIDGAVSVSSLVGSDGYVVASSQLDNRVFALDAATGDLVWDADAAENATSSAAYADGRLVTADTSGTVRAFHPVGTVAGTVTGPDGPVAATVRVTETGAEVPVGDDGRFELNHRPGDYTLEVRHYGLRPRSVDVTVVAGRTRTVDVRLESAGAGAVDGQVTDEDGSPLEGVTVTLAGTPLEPATTDADGRFSFGDVSEGGYRLRAELTGFVPHSESVEVRSDETTTVDIALAVYDVAVVGDYEERIGSVLADLGYTVQQSTYAEVTQQADDFEVVVANGAQDDPGEAAFHAFLDATDAAGTSVVWLDQWSLGWGAINHLTNYLGDPAEIVDDHSNAGRVSLVPRLDHPLVEGLPLDERTQILEPNDWSAFTGYSGVPVADLETGDDGVVGTGLAFKARGIGSAHVLVGSLAAAASWGDPSRYWTPAARTVLDNAVGYAETVSYGRAVGTVRDGAGQPLAAELTVGETGQRAVAGADGTYRLLLDPGTYTVRFAADGRLPVERTITVDGGQTTTTDVTLADAGVGTVRGVVTAQASGQPIAGATVTLAGQTATTSAAGGYAIADVPGGPRQLTVASDGYFSASVAVDVAAGQETVADVELRSAPRVGVLDDYSRDGVIPVLRAGDIVAEPLEWSDVDRVGDFDVIVFNDPDDPGEQTFRSFLTAMDDAQVSGVFPDDRFSTAGGAWLLRKHLGDPAGSTSVRDEGIISYRAVEPDHPLFDGLGGSPEILRADRYAATIDGYGGVPLADLATEGSTSGVAAAYRGRTPGSVHLLLSGLAATLFQGPGEDWTEDGKQLYRNAITWAADPGLGGVEGTVTDAEGAPVAATVRAADTALELTAGADGRYLLPLAPGPYTLEFDYFGHETVTREVTVTAGDPITVDVPLPAATDASVTGQVTAAGATVDGAAVTLRGTPLRTTTDADGRYRFSHVEAGSYEVDVHAAGHVRSRTSVAVDGSVVEDVQLRPSPRVGVVKDYQDRLAGYLEYWGYQAESIGWSDTAALGDLDLVVANLGSSDDPGAAGFAAFSDAANRAGVSVLWLDQSGRGSFQYLERYEGDPAGLGQGRNDGAVTAHAQDSGHPLLAGLPESFPLVDADEEYSWFDDFSGQTVATVTADSGDGGDLVGVRPRGAQAVDILLGTLSVSTYGYPAYGDSPARSWSAEAERLLRNALVYGTEAPALGGEVRGTVVDAAGDPLGGTVTVVETGRDVAARPADGSFVIPLAPGEWTLRAQSFGYDDTEVPVSIEAGEVATPRIELTRQPRGSVAGTVTGAGGAPVEGATVTVEGTGFTATTDAGGTYRIDDIPVGEWTVRFGADGHQAARRDITVRAGETASLDIQLAGTRTVAVVGDYSDSVHDLLTGEGYTVRSYSYSELDALVADLDALELVIFNGSVWSSYREAFAAAVSAAEESGTSTIFGSQWGGYAIGALSEVRGDPADVEYSFVPDGIDYVPAAEHPIFDGFAVGEPIPLITEDGTNQQWAAFVGYSGQTIGAVADRAGARLGDAVGYRYTSPASVEILLGSLSASGYGQPGDEWTPDAERIYLNAVEWAIDTEAARVAGTVTGAGEPVAGAAVRAVEAGVEAETAADGTYALAVPGGTHTVEVSAPGFETVSRQVVVDEGERVTVDVDLVPLPRGSVTGTVTSSDGSVVAGATVRAEGPQEWTARTDDAGGYTVDDVLAGDYDVTVAADGYLPADATVTVPSDDTARLDVTLHPLDVGVLGDVDGRLTSYLREHEVAAGSLSWSPDLDVAPYDVLVVNGGDPSKATFESVLAAADEHGTSVIFSGSWGVDVGGVRLLERYTGRVAVTAQGYGDGPVELTGFDADHPLFDGLSDPAELLVPGGYYSVLGGYAGAPLADVAVERSDGSAVSGLGVGYDWRTADSVEVVLSASAVTDAVGPGEGWTAAGGRLVRNAIGFARDARLETPEPPVVELPAPGVTLAETVTITGTASWPSDVEVAADGEPVATAATGLDGTWSVKIPVAVGANRLTAVATNLAGSSGESDPVTMWRWRPHWKVSGSGPARVVQLELEGAPRFDEPADSATLVIRADDGTVADRVQMRWTGSRYLAPVRRLPPDSHDLAAELVVDGHTLEVDGPPL